MGIPYPNLGNPKIEAKRRFNNWKRTDQSSRPGGGGGGPRSWPEICAAGDHEGRVSSSSSSSGSGSGVGGAEAGEGGGGGEAAAMAARQLLNGNDWYSQEAFRALNQVIIFVHRYT